MRVFGRFRLKLDSILIGLVILGLGLPRFLALDRFVTPDEPKWLMRSGVFFTALSNQDWFSTLTKAHPGVTITWLGMAGYLLSYPEFATDVNYHIDHSREIERILRERNHQPMDVLTAGRVFVVLTITLVLILSLWAAIRLVGLWAALVGFALIAFDPFNIALTRLLHLDGLMSCLVLLSILAYLNFLYRGRRWQDLLLSAVAAGFGWLTKSPALFLAPFLALLGLIDLARLFYQERRWSWKAVWNYVGPMLVWSVTGWVIFFVFFPAMWVKPVEVLRDVFSLSQEYATEGHSSVIFFRGYIIDGDPGRRFYLVSYLWRVTPVTLIGLALAGVAFVTQRWLPKERSRLWLATALVLFAGFFNIFMTIGAKKFDRYLLPVYAPLDLVAGIGWVIALQWLAERLRLWRAGRQAAADAAPAKGKRLNVRLVQAVSLTPLLLGLAAIIFQVASAMGTYPYYFSYYNPLIGGSRRAPEVMMIGWGEGLDQAARYLNTKPDAQHLRVVSWYPDGCFSYLFNGETLYMPPEWAAADHMIKSADYVVMYIHQWQRDLPFEQMLKDFRTRTPEHVIVINGIDYVKIYNMHENQQP